MQCRYPFHIGMAGGVILPLSGGGMLTNLTTLAEELRDEGYSTHAVGKWHLGHCSEEYLPTSRGFHHHYGYWLGAEDYYNHTDEYDGHVGYDFRDDLVVDTSARGVYSTDLFRNRAVEIIESHDQSSPLFLYLAFQSPHAPLQAPEKYKELYDDVEDKDRREYLGMVTAMDEAVGGVIKSLKKEKMFENTIVVFLSDNGANIRQGGSNWPFRGKKGSLWEGATRTPAFIHGPGLTSRVEQNIFHITDWYPTIMEIINKNIKGPPIDGIGAWKALTQNSLNWKRNEFVYNLRQTQIDSKNPWAAIRIGNWKYIWGMADGYAGWEVPSGNGTMEVERLKSKSYTNLLFNLAEDPQEKNNLTSIETTRALMMQTRLKTHMKTIMHNMFKQHLQAGIPEKHEGIWSTGWC